MGVPAFFRWLSKKYPCVIIECNENKVFETTKPRNSAYKHVTLERRSGNWEEYL